MSQQKLRIALDLIETLAKQSASSFGVSSGKSEQVSLKKIIEAARSNYILPSYCAEISSDAKECIHCIVEHIPPAKCLKKDIESSLEDHKVEWDMQER